jgi:ribonuclease HII
MTELPVSKLLVAGVDEAGRGPLAGPVVAAAVILPSKHPIAGLNDSKKLSEMQREQLFAQIIEYAVAYHVCFVHSDEIDEVNILQATMLGMQRAVCALSVQPQRVLIDGNRVPKNLPCEAQAIVKGDGKEQCIMAASILAKVSRDRWMHELHAEYPQYGFGVHKGYPTPDHLAALNTHGPCPVHRRSFAPVRNLLQEHSL